MEALPKPPGGDQNKGPVYLAVALTFCAVALVFVLLRMYVRTRMLRSMGWDDAFVCFAMVVMSSGTFAVYLRSNYILVLIRF